jgi:hypothetical protein
LHADFQGQANGDRPWTVRMEPLAAGVWMRQVR